MKNWLKIPHYRVLSSILLASFFCFAALLLLLYKLDPYENTAMALSLFFVVDFFLLTGIFTSILFFLKKWKSHDKIYLKHMNISMRQGVFLSILVNICLGLLILGLLRVWNGLLIVSIITLLEYNFSLRDELN